MMAGNPWEPWLDEIEEGLDGDHAGRLREGLAGLRRFPFHEQSGQLRGQWDRLFAVLFRLLGNEEQNIRNLAYHYVWVALWLESGRTGTDGTASRDDRARQAARRTADLLPALAPLVRGGAMSLLRCTDDLVHTEGLVDLGPQGVYRHWIDSFGQDEALALAARIAYFDGRGPWEAPGQTLQGLLDHQDNMVRAYAARAWGRRYAASCDDDLAPPLREVVALLTAKEIERPGIAGPFFSNWYDHSTQDFAQQAGVDIEEWLCTILANRRQAEPDTLPCSNGIDFFAHEVLGGRPSYVRRLIDMGHRELAVQAATEIGGAIDGMEPLLAALADATEADVCRQASWHLAYYYRVLHPAGERRGFVARRALAVAGAELFVNLWPLPGGGSDEGHEGQESRGSQGSQAYSAVLYPPRRERFDEEAAAACLEIVLPQFMRGGLLPYGMPGDDGKPGLYVREHSTHARYECGALVEHHGDVAAKRWERIRIIWQGPAGAWRPEALP